MCGIFGYVGKRNAAPILIEGLNSLEYRGYDSAGIYVPESGCMKSVGPVKNLRRKLSKNVKGTSGIAHLRWATHGKPNQINAHPHRDCAGEVWVVHNGIIDNYQDLKNKLTKLGHKFVSETDTEVLAHLAEQHLKKGGNFEQAVVKTLREVRGTYGLVFSYHKEPDKIIAARMGAPVVIGLGQQENFVASDPSPILSHTKRVIYLNDKEVAVISSDSQHIYNLDLQEIRHSSEMIEWNADQVQKSGYPHFMFKEIMEGPEVIKNTLRGRILVSNGLAKLGGLESVAEQLRSVRRIIIVGCGTAYYAGLVGEYMIEEQAGIPVEVEVGSEFRYRKPVVNEGTVLLAISQSGETADTLEAIREAKRKNILTLGIVNTVGSTIARETDAGIFNHAGPEIGVASTKAFLSQLTALALLALFLGRQRQMPLAIGQRIAEELTSLPQKIEKILANKKYIKSLAKKYSKYKNFLYIGRKYNYPIALEGALKLKEVSYVHAEGCGAGEMKHGPLAMIDENFPTVAIALKDSVFEKMISNMQEIKARKGKILALTHEDGKKDVSFLADVICIPKTLEMLSPILSVVPLQLFAYYLAVEKGLNVDQPRNLAKSVTVE